MGLVNTVVPVDQLEAEGVQWAQEILKESPIAIRFLKAGFNADLDGQTGLQVLAGDATMLYAHLFITSSSSRYTASLSATYISPAIS